MISKYLHPIRIRKLNRVIYPKRPDRDSVWKITNFGLTRRQAKQVRFYRCERGYTWRAVARAMYDKYPQLNINRGNQIDGMDLCQQAMELLKEPVGAGWN